MIPGWKICKNCYEKVTKELTTEQLEDDREFEESFQRDLEEDGNSLEVSREEFNSSLAFSGVSPLKLHGLRKPNQISAAKGKLWRLTEHHEEMAARVIRVGVANIALSSTAASDILRREEREKAAELDRLYFLLKEKLTESSKEEKVQIGKRNFGKPEAKLENRLPELMISLATEFFQDDENSRIMPGKKIL